MKNNRRGVLIILSSPSGAGKSSLAQDLIKWDHNIVFSISSTTRGARPGEKDGREYNFTSIGKFKAMVTSKKMLEHAEVFGNLYGSPLEPVEQALNSGKDVLFDIDWQGTQQLYQSKPSNLVSIFILPPSKDEIESRLRQRRVDSGDDESIINFRMSKFKDEISHWVEYDYVVNNENLEICVKEILNIINVERKKRHRLTDLVDKVRELTL